MEHLSTIPGLFAGNDRARLAYSALMSQIAALPGVQIEEKKTCIHLVAGTGAFLGVHPRKAGLRLNIVLNRSLSEPRVVKSEQVSARRYHNEIDFDGTELDSELAEWIREAYDLKTSAN